MKKQFLILIFATTLFASDVFWMGFKDSYHEYDFHAMNDKKELSVGFDQGINGRFTIYFRRRNRDDLLQALEKFEFACADSSFIGDFGPIDTVRSYRMFHGYSMGGSSIVGSPNLTFSVMRINDACRLLIFVEHSTSYGGYINSTPKSLMFDEENVVEFRDMVRRSYE